MAKILMPDNQNFEGFCICPNCNAPIVYNLEDIKNRKEKETFQGGWVDKTTVYEGDIICPNPECGNSIHVECNK